MVSKRLLDPHGGINIVINTVECGHLVVDRRNLAIPRSALPNIKKLNTIAVAKYLH